MKILKALSAEEIDRIVEMAWEDRTPFDAIEVQFGINESQVIQLMRKNMKESSFKMWRARVQGRKTKHGKKSKNKIYFDNIGSVTVSQLSRRLTNVVKGTSVPGLKASVVCGSSSLLAFSVLLDRRERNDPSQPLSSITGPTPLARV